MAKKTATKKSPEKKPAKKIAATKKRSSSSKSTKRNIKTKEEPKDFLVNAVIEGMKERKALNIKLLDLRDIQNRVSDFFVISEAESTTHVNSIADSVSETVKKLTGERPFHTEGWENSQWILLDYVNVVAHVFMRETREFYNIEGLWSDAKITDC